MPRWLLLASFMAILAPGAGSGQDPDSTIGMYPVNAATRIREVRFQVDGSRSLSGEQLRAAVALKDPRTFRKVIRGLRGRGTGRLGGEDQRFNPGEMIRDLERLRRLYAREGLPGARVGFSLDVDERENTVAVTYRIREGEPLRVGRIWAEDTSGVRLPEGLPRDVSEGWRSVSDALSSFHGARLSQRTVGALENRVTSWLGDRGYGFATTRAISEEPDSILVADVRLVVDVGPRLTVDSIEVRGIEQLGRRTILDELPFREGDWISTRELVDGRRELMGLDMVRFALVDFTQDSQAGARVEIDVEEGPLRLVTGEVGYESRTGPSIQASWSHRNFLGGARSLTVQVRAQTGEMALVEQPERLLRLTTSVGDPRFFDRRVSWTTSLFGELSEDPVFKARRAGVENLILYAASPSFSVDLNANFARRWIDEYRFGVALSRGIDFFQLLSEQSEGLLDELKGRQSEGDLAVEAVLGRIDLDEGARGSWTLRPRVAFSAPSWASDIHYVRFDGTLQASANIGAGIRVTARAGGGHLIPYGSSMPQHKDEQLGKFLRLRRVLFTAGGSGDVRGWGSGLLGPKFPELILRSEGDSVRFEGRGFSPIGGTSKVMASVQAELPLPLTPDWLAGLIFLDGGRIWTSDGRLAGAEDDPQSQERFFWAAGGGMVLHSPVGRIEVALGVKLNPTVMDLASATQVLNAILEDRSLNDLPTRDRRRLQLHVSLGVGG